MNMWFIIMADGRGDGVLVHNHLLNSCPGIFILFIFKPKHGFSIRPCFFCASFQIKSPPSRVLWQYAERVWKVSSVGPNHLWRARRGGLVHRENTLVPLFSGKKKVLSVIVKHIVRFEVNIEWSKKEKYIYVKKKKRIIKLFPLHWESGMVVTDVPSVQSVHSWRESSLTKRESLNDSCVRREEKISH